jgi:hypothetical protein
MITHGKQLKPLSKLGGEGGIRTLGTLIRGTHDFQSCTFNRSVTSPVSNLKHLLDVACSAMRRCLQNVSIAPWRHCHSILSKRSTSFNTLGKLDGPRDELVSEPWIQETNISRCHCIDNDEECPVILGPIRLKRQSHVYAGYGHICTIENGHRFLATRNRQRDTAASGTVKHKARNGKEYEQQLHDRKPQPIREIKPQPVPEIFHECATFPKNYHAGIRIAKAESQNGPRYTIETPVLQKNLRSLNDLWRHVSTMSPPTGE